MGMIHKKLWNDTQEVDYINYFQGEKGEMGMEWEGNFSPNHLLCFFNFESC